MSKPNISYLSRDYQTLLDSIKEIIPSLTKDWSDFSETDIGMILISLFIGVKDLQSFTMDKMFLESFLSTVTQRQNLILLLDTYGYTLRGYRAASGLIYKGLDDVDTPAIGDAFVYSDTSGKIIDLVYHGETDTVEVGGVGKIGYRVYQGSNGLFGSETLAFGTLVSEVDGMSLNDSDKGRVCIAESMQRVAIDSSLCFLTGNKQTQNLNYIRKDTFIGLETTPGYDPTKKYYRVYVDYDNRTYLEFFNPDLVKTDIVWFTFVYTDGSGVYIPKGAEVYRFGDISPTRLFLTGTEVSGGLGEETVDEARDNVPGFLRSVNRAITKDDYDYVMQQYLKTISSAFDGMDIAVNILDQYMNATIYPEAERVAQFPQINNLVWISAFRTVEVGGVPGKVGTDTNNKFFGPVISHETEPNVESGEYWGFQSSELSNYINGKRMLGVFVSGTHASTVDTSDASTRKLDVVTYRIEFTIAGASLPYEVKKRIANALLEKYQVSNESYARNITVFDVMSVILSSYSAYNAADLSSLSVKISEGLSVLGPAVATLTLSGTSSYQCKQNVFSAVWSVEFI